MSSVISLFSSLKGLPRIIVRPKPRLVASLSLKNPDLIERVRVTWTQPRADSRKLWRRPLRNRRTNEGTSLFFSRKWRYPERKGNAVEITFRSGAVHRIELDEENIATISTQAEIDEVPVVEVQVPNSQEKVRVRICVLDMIPASLPSDCIDHLHPENTVGHSLFLVDHRHEHPSIFERVKDTVFGIGAEIQESASVIQKIFGNQLKAIGLSVEHIRDFVGAIFNRFTTDLPHHLATTVAKLETIGKNILEHILKDLWAYLNGLVAIAEHKFLSNKESYIYPPPPVHISKDGKTWQNWGNNLRATPAKIFSDDNAAERSITSLAHLQAVIANATRTNQLPVRVFGSAHSWASIGQTNGTLLDGRKFGWVKNNPRDADVFDQETVEKYIDYKYLYVTPEDPLVNGLPTVTFPPGLATGTVERWIYYSPKDQAGAPINNRYSLGTSTYEDVFTMGGIVAAACHGTGRNYPTVSDWLVSVEFVDAKSIIRRVNVKGETFQRNREEDAWAPWDVSAEFGVTGVELFKAVICSYGLLGVLWSLTIRIIPGFNTLFIAEMIPWADFLDDTVASRQNLNALQNNSSSLEFFYYPFGTTGLVAWQKNPTVYMLRHLDDSPENRELLQHEGYKIVEKSEDYFLLRDLKTRFFAGIFYGIITGLLKAPTFLSGLVLPYVLAQIPNNLEYTANNKKREAISLPHWRANHSVNAVGAVEQIRVLNIEWTVPMTFNEPSGDGLSHALRIHSHLIKSIHKAADNREFPVTVVAEIRFFRGSGAWLAPEYDPNFSFPDDPFEKPPAPYGGWAAPEIVTGVHNPWWLDFYKKMNDQVYKKINNEVPVRNHLAKQYSSIPKQLTRLRSEFDREEYAVKPFTVFRNIRQKLDPDGVFLVPLMHQFLDTNARQYTAPNGYPIAEDGTFPDLIK